MDVYSEVVQSDAAELINSPFGGRYCGAISPRRRVSLYRAIALAFYTDKNVSSSDLFEGRYAFINDCKYVRIFNLLVSTIYLVTVLGLNKYLFKLLKLKFGTMKHHVYFFCTLGRSNNYVKLSGFAK